MQITKEQLEKAFAKWLEEEAVAKAEGTLDESTPENCANYFWEVLKGVTGNESN